MAATKPPILRFAPSPTGSPHLGSLRTLLFNHLYATKINAKLILRIDDTDRKRNCDESLRKVQEMYEWITGRKEGGVKQVPKNFSRGEREWWKGERRWVYN